MNRALLLAALVSLGCSHLFAYLHGRSVEARYNVSVTQAIEETRYLRGVVSGQLARSLGVSDRAVRACLIHDRRVVDSLALLVAEVE